MSGAEELKALAEEGDGVLEPILVEPIRGTKAQAQNGVLVRGGGTPLLPGCDPHWDDGFVCEGTTTTRGSMLKDLLDRNVSPRIQAIKAQKKNLFSRAKDLLSRHVRFEIDQKNCLETLQGIYVQYVGLAESGCFSKLVNISFRQMMRHVVRRSGVVSLAVTSNHQEALELFIRWGVSLNQSSENSNLFWNAVDQGHIELAKFIFKTIGVDVFKGPDFLTALENSIETAIEFNKTGLIEFLRDWVLSAEHMDPLLVALDDADSLMVYQSFFLNTLMAQEAYELLDQSLNKSTYRGFELWNVSDQMLLEAFKELSVAWIEVEEASDEEGSVFTLTTFDYALQNNLHVLLFYLWAFDIGVPDLSSSDLLDWDLFLTSNSGDARQCLVTFANLLSAHDCLLSEDQIAGLAMSGLERLRVKLLEVSMQTRNWSAFNRLLMTAHGLNKKGFARALEIFVVEPSFIKLLQEKLNAPLLLRCNDHEMRQKISLMDFAVLKSYVGLLALILSLGEQGQLSLDPCVVNQAFDCDMKENKKAIQSHTKRILSFQQVFNVSPNSAAIKLFFGKLINQAGSLEKDSGKDPEKDLRAETSPADSIASSVSVSPPGGAAVSPPESMYSRVDFLEPLVPGSSFVLRPAHREARASVTSALDHSGQLVSLPAI